MLRVRTPALRQIDTFMRVHKMSNQFVTRYEDVQDGDTISIADEGEFREGEYGTKLVVIVTLANGVQKKLSLNPISVNALIAAFGAETTAWVGKLVKVQVAQMTVRDTLRDVIFVKAREESGE